MWFVDYCYSGSYKQAYFPTEDLARHFTWWATDRFGKRCTFDVYYAEIKTIYLSSVEERYMVEFLEAEEKLFGVQLIARS